MAAGRVDRVGQLYQISLELIEPRTGATLSSRIERVSTPAKLLTSMGPLAVWATHTLQNTPPLTPVETLPQVTTPSLAALRLYARALEALQRNHRQEARVLLTSAVNDDPGFASAHSRLSLVLSNETALDAWRPHDSRAVALSTGLPDLERLRIMGRHFMMTGDGDGAIASLEALSRIDPADVEALTSLSGLYYRQRRMAEAVDARVRVSSLRPNDWVEAASTAQAVLLWAGNVDSARAYVQRATELRAKDSTGFSSEVGRVNLPPGHARFASWLLYFHAYEPGGPGTYEVPLPKFGEC